MQFVITYLLNSLRFETKSQNADKIQDVFTGESNVCLDHFYSK